MFRQGRQTRLEDPRGQITRTEEFGGQGKTLKVRVPGSASQKDRPSGGQKYGDRPLKQRPHEKNQRNIVQRYHFYHSGCKTSYTRLYHDLSEHKKKTLNEPYRKRELLKIVEENQDMLKRLQLKRSEYNIRKMEKERKKIEKNISLISEFPYKGMPHSRTAVNVKLVLVSYGRPLTILPKNRRCLPNSILPSEASGKSKGLPTL